MDFKELKWDETDFLDCLEVFPSVDEDRISYHYEVVKDGLVMTVGLSTLDSCVFISLRQASNSQPNIEHAFVARDGVVFVDNKEGPYQEFRGCFLTRLWAWDTGCTEEEFRTKRGLTIQVGIKPQIQIRFD